VCALRAGSFLTLSPCGRGWLARSKCEREPGDGELCDKFFAKMTSPASLTAFARHLFPQGERGSGAQ